MAMEPGTRSTLPRAFQRPRQRAGPKPRRPLEAFLKSHGWRGGDSLRTPRDVAIPPYGLVGFAAIYCQPESVDQLAAGLRGIGGADLIVSRNPGGKMATIREAGSKAIAELEWSADGRGYRYNAREGDPLKLKDLFGRLRASGKLDGEGFASDAEQLTIWMITSRVLQKLQLTIRLAVVGCDLTNTSLFGNPHINQ
jgi:hypothetical protein